MLFRARVAGKYGNFFEALAIMLHMNEELVALLNEAKQDAAVRHTDDKHSHEAIGHYLDTKSRNA